MQTNGNDRINRQKSGRKGLSAYHMALGGILLALCIAGVFMSSIVPGAEMTLLLVASAGIFIFCREAGAAGGAVLYAAACGLSLILVPNKLAVLPLALVFGLYPVIKYLLEKAAGTPQGLLQKAPQGAAKNKVVCLLGKTVYYGLAGALAVTVFSGVFFGDAALSFPPAVSEWPAGLLLAAGWVVFIAYDVILTACGIWYKHRFAGRVPGTDRTEESAFVPPEIILSDPGQNAQEAGADTTSDAPRHTDME